MPSSSQELSALTVIKPPLGPDDTRRRREGRLLERLTDPGIVELVAMTETDDGVALHLAAVGDGRTLADAPPLDVADITDIARQLAGTVATLHRHDVVHRALTADHVLLDEQHRTVLCGFGEWSDAGPEHPPSIDVMAVGALILRLLDAAEAAGTIDRSEPGAASLEQLAHLAVNHPTDDGAELLAERLEDIETAGRQPALRDRLDLAAVGRVAGGLALGCLITASAVAGWRAISDTRTRPPSEAAPPTESAPPTEPVLPSDPVPPSDPAQLTTTTTPASERELLLATSTCDPINRWADGGDEDGWVDLTGDGCAEPWRFDDEILEIGARRYALSDVQRVEFADCGGEIRLVMFTGLDSAFTVDALPMAAGRPVTARSASPSDCDPA